MEEKKIKKGELTPEEREVLEMFLKADEVKGQTLSFNEKSEVVLQNEIDAFINDKFDNPEKKYDAFYKGTQKILLDRLPTGQDFEKVRRIVLDEKNVFLSRGKKKDKNGVRHADVRMGYTEDHEEALRIVARWALEGGSVASIYKAFWTKNEEMGYGHQEEQATSAAFLEAMQQNEK